jgi:hypothetical protein
MTEHAEHLRRVMDEACAVLERLATDLTRLLDQSWRGDGAREALEAMHRFISEAVDGFARCQSVPAVPGATAPVGYGGVPMGDTASSPAFRRTGFDDHTNSSPTRPTGQTPAMIGAQRATDNPLPAASLNAAAMPSAPSPAAPQPAAGPQQRGGIPYMPLMGAGFAGALAREDGGTRRTPGYLISIDNGNELIGPLPKAAPPVWGIHSGRL